MNKDELIQVFDWLEKNMNKTIQNTLYKIYMFLTAILVVVALFTKQLDIAFLALILAKLIENDRK